MNNYNKIKPSNPLLMNNSNINCNASTNISANMVNNATINNNRNYNNTNVQTIHKLTNENKINPNQNNITNNNVKCQATLKKINPNKNNDFNNNINVSEIEMEDCTKEKSNVKAHTEEIYLSDEEINIIVKNGETKSVLNKIANKMMDDLRSKKFLL